MRIWQSALNGTVDNHVLSWYVVSSCMILWVCRIGVELNGLYTIPCTHTKYHKPAIPQIYKILELSSHELEQM